MNADPGEEREQAKESSSPKPAAVVLCLAGAIAYAGICLEAQAPDV
jgi:hypothetical protein